MPRAKKNKRQTSTTAVASSSKSAALRGYHEIKGILREKLDRDGAALYFVAWAGINPVTGRPYKPTWPKDNITFAALFAWEQIKKGTVQASEGASGSSDGTPKTSKRQRSESHSATGSESPYKRQRIVSPATVPEKLVITLRPPKELRPEDYTIFSDLSDVPTPAPVNPEADISISQHTIPDSQGSSWAELSHLAAPDNHRSTTNNISSQRSRNLDTGATQHTANEVSGSHQYIPSRQPDSSHFQIDSSKQQTSGDGDSQPAVSFSPIIFPNSTCDASPERSADHARPLIRTASSSHGQVSAIASLPTSDGNNSQIFSTTLSSQLLHSAQIVPASAKANSAGESFESSRPLGSCATASESLVPISQSRSSSPRLQPAAAARTLSESVKAQAALFNPTEKVIPCSQGDNETQNSSGLPQSHRAVSESSRGTAAARLPLAINCKRSSKIGAQKRHLGSPSDTHRSMDSSLPPSASAEPSIPDWATQSSAVSQLPLSELSTDMEPEIPPEVDMMRGMDRFLTPSLSSSLAIHVASVPQLRQDEEVSTIAPSALMTSMNPDMDLRPESPVVPSALMSSANPDIILHPESPEVSSSPEEVASSVETNELLVTLPMTTTMRQRYLRLIIDSLEVWRDFDAAMSSAIAPNIFLSEQVKKSLNALRDVADLPLSDHHGLPTAQMTKIATGTNSKMLFLQKLLKDLRDVNLQVLMLARPGRPCEYLEALLETSEVGYRRVTDSQTQTKGESPLNVILASTDQSPTLLPDPATVDVVIGYDEEASRSGLVTPFIYCDSDDTRPKVLSLVATHTIDHVANLLDRTKTLDSLQRLHALVFATMSLMELLKEPPKVGERGDPHIVAQNLASLIKDPGYSWAWMPVAIPDNAFDFHSSSDEAVARSVSVSVGRKRALDDMDDRADDSKRLKSSGLSEAVLSSLSQLPSDGPTIQISIACLEALNKENSALKEQLEQQKRLSNSKDQRLNILGEQNQSFEMIIRKFQKKYSAILDYRTKLAKELDRMTKERELEISKAVSSAVRKEHGALQQRLNDLANSEDGDLAKLGKLEQELQLVQKKLATMEKDLEFARSAYQDASSRAAELGQENKSLVGQNRRLQVKADENRVKVNEIHHTNEVAELQRMRRQLQDQLADREAIIERQGAELRVSRNGRRDTRGGSVPRSPRLAVASPRGNGGGGPRSRGTSPVPGSAAAAGEAGMVPTFSGNRRFDHLRH